VRGAVIGCPRTAFDRACFRVHAHRSPTILAPWNCAFGCGGGEICPTDAVPEVPAPVRTGGEGRGVRGCGESKPGCLISEHWRTQLNTGERGRTLVNTDTIGMSLPALVPAIAVVGEPGARFARVVALRLRDDRVPCRPCRLRLGDTVTRMGT